ncbi:Crp/Fnr family transcriptional regulator [Galbibacter sp.]|uniref:Crp/Fnr family transcriptional regulator n=1 Tax=Galbibacter sp. TaxID=2918471 RepID=UPI003A91D56F
MDIDLILDNIYPLPDTSKELLKKSISEVKHKKGHILLRSDVVEKNIYFIKKEIARAYAHKDHAEITFWFGKEGDTIISMKSYISNQKGYENIELLENCELYQLKTENLQRLYQKDIHITNFGRIFAEKELIKTEERLIFRQIRTATQRYNELLKNSPVILQRVQLRHIASYLGITQVSLSRIRAEIT